MVKNSQDRAQNLLDQREKYRSSRTADNVEPSDISSISAGGESTQNSSNPVLSKNDSSLDDSTHETISSPLNDLNASSNSDEVSILNHAGECCDTRFEPSIESPELTLQPCIVPNSQELGYYTDGDPFDPTCPRKEIYPRYRTPANELDPNSHETYPQIGQGVYPSLDACVVGGPLPPGSSFTREQLCGDPTGNPTPANFPPIYVCEGPHADWYNINKVFPRLSQSPGYHASYYDSCYELDDRDINFPICGDGRTLTTVPGFGERCLGNQPPFAFATASPNPVNTGESVTLDGSQSHDPDDSIVAYQWSQIDPPGGIIGNSQTIQFTAPEVEEETTIRIGLTVRDSHDATGLTYVDIVVLAQCSEDAVATESISLPSTPLMSANQLPITSSIFCKHPPIAIATSIPKDSAVIGQSVILDGDQSYDPDPGDEIINYDWKQESNGAPPVNIIKYQDPTLKSRATFTSPNIVPTRVTSDQSPPEKISLKFNLEVTDNHGLKSLPLPQSSVSLQLTCNPEEERTIDKVRQQLQVIFGWYDTFDLEHATYALKKWLSGDDSNVDLDINWLRTTEPIQTGESTNEKRFLTKHTMSGPTKGESLVKILDEVAKDGKTRTFGDTWDYSLDVPIHIFDTNSLDFDLTVGSVQLSSVGNFEISRPADGMLHLTGTVHHFISQKINGVKQAYDMVDFNPGEQFPPKAISKFTERIPGVDIPTIINDELNLMKKCYGANDYKQSANWDRNVDITNTYNTLRQLLKHGTLSFNGP